MVLTASSQNLAGIRFVPVEKLDFQKIAGKKTEKQK
jgi:hypothetical protein